MNNEQYFLEQTAKDYDIDIDTIKEVYKRYPENFYEVLEQIIEEQMEDC